MWEFETDPEFQEKLDWIAEFVREEVEPLDVLWPRAVFKRPMAPEVATIVKSLQQQVRDQGLWACHLGPDLGGLGYGQLKLALINEILGRSHWAAVVFGTQAPDTGNAEILAHFGTPEQKARYLQPLLDSEIVSAYSMTEPQGGSDPAVFTCSATRDGDGWILDGWKFFSSHARYSSFLVVMARTDQDAPVHNAFSMFLVPKETPGVDIVRNIGIYGEAPDDGAHGLVHYDQVRLGPDALLGAVGQGFAVAQVRLGGGRVHHAMRAVGICQRALDMMCERALSRETRGSKLADKQAVQGYIADSWAELQQFRLFVLQTAWKIDRYNDYGKVREDIAAIKVLSPKVIRDIVGRSIQVHGALGVSNELDLARLYLVQFVTGFSDGPSEIHQATVARRVLKRYSPAPSLWPTEHLPSRRDDAEAHVAKRLSELGFEG
jgi:acyl-CoA dehydrogenase